MDVVIYTKDNCPFCVRAKQFFAQRNINFAERKVGVDIVSEDYRSKISKTVPAIFVDGNMIGGYDQLMLLNQIRPDMFANG